VIVVRDRNPDFPVAVNMRDGHDEARSRLACALEAARDGTGTVLLVDGEPGIGRTRLLADAVKTAQRQGISVCTGRGDELTRWTPLAPLAGAVGETVWVSGGDSMRLATRLLDALSERAKAGPLLVVLDDVQWSDPMTLAALRSFPAQLSAHPVVWRR
jgi:predicted ATPase